MRVIIPVAGLGTRLLPHTKNHQKCLLPVAGKLVIDYILEPLIRQDFRDIVLITGYLEDQVKSYVSKFKANFTFIRQQKALGLGHAVFLGLEESDNPVLIQLGDVIYNLDFKKFCQSDNHKIAVDRVPDPERFGIVIVQGGKIVNVLEKPKNPPTNLGIVGLYYLKNQRPLYRAIRFLMDNNITTNNEIQLADAFQRMIEKGETIASYFVPRWYDCGIPETFLSTNAALLKTSRKKIQGSTIIEPVSIKENTTIINSTIGPYVTIMDGSIIKNSFIKDSIILWDSKIIDQSIEHQIVGKE